MYRAKETIWAPGNRHIVKGDLIAPHDPVIKGREELFETVVIPQAVQPGQSAETPVEDVPEHPPPSAKDEDTTELSPHPAPSGSEQTPAAGGAGDTPAPAPARAPAAKKTAAKKTTPAARKPAGGDAK